jgi:hypothetical protein
MDRRRKKTKPKARQLTLVERSQPLPHWATLPQECRLEIVALLARLVRNEIVAEWEVEDE